ncbi:hypothetical protein EV421DRAFT_2019140 [Armillaria borealis]|uniref:Uncharacterized protein n=1 Tax=Armillaria borealis TaxID=47425 RepID=A0AA39JI33_9AGAR|nr:hypothetical protein EV421DRAFT_2019140 [Armillaria borealis]
MSTSNIWLYPPPMHHLLRPSQSNTSGLSYPESDNSNGVTFFFHPRPQELSSYSTYRGALQQHPSTPRLYRSSDDGESGESRKMTFHTVLHLDGLEHDHHSAGDCFSFLLVDDGAGLEILHVHAMTILEVSPWTISVMRWRGSRPEVGRHHENHHSSVHQSPPVLSIPTYASLLEGAPALVEEESRVALIADMFQALVPTTYQGWNDRAIELDARYWQNRIVTQLSAMGVVEWELLGKDQLLIGKSRLTDGWILQRCADGASALSAKSTATWRVTAQAIFAERLDIENDCLEFISCKFFVRYAHYDIEDVRESWRQWPMLRIRCARARRVLHFSHNDLKATHYTLPVLFYLRHVGMDTRSVKLSRASYWTGEGYLIAAPIAERMNAVVLQFSR